MVFFRRYPGKINPSGAVKSDRAPYQLPTIFILNHIGISREDLMMKPANWLFFLLIFILALAGCTPVSPTIQPTQVMLLPSPTSLPATDTVTPTSTQAPTDTETPSPTITQTPPATLGPESVKETMQPLLQNPMNCHTPCFWGIIPQKTRFDEIRIFFSRLGFVPFEGNFGKDFYTIEYTPDNGPKISVTFYINKNLARFKNIKN